MKIKIIATYKTIQLSLQRIYKHTHYEESEFFQTNKFKHYKTYNETTSCVEPNLGE